MGQSILPTQAHAIAGKLEDALTIWRSRPAGVYHQRYADANTSATELCGEMIAVFGRLRDELTAGRGAYDDERRKGT